MEKNILRNIEILSTQIRVIQLGRKVNSTPAQLATPLKTRTPHSHSALALHTRTVITPHTHSALTLN